MATIPICLPTTAMPPTSEPAKWRPTWGTRTSDRSCFHHVQTIISTPGGPHAQVPLLCCLTHRRHGAHSEFLALRARSRWPRRSWRAKPDGAYRPPPTLVGGWKVVDPTEARLKPIAKYVVDQWKLKQPSSPSATLTKIISAKEQVVSGVKYDVELELKPSNGSSVKVHAVVWDRFGDLKVLQME